ncbi:hypothetical protein PGTUg99_033897 [Puccinia graminis f. sp. tritici]|uniref:Uncharacterized protein n=1 Tax=Puccinia graminis f. sp. tritici TaxID=56615 RepID=A0A5B0R9R2_PUCGR|nr:hypothetical protein PGTUg99_033897 [Puccinia graminis f. sp. tritici]
MKQLVDSLAEELPPTKRGRVGLGLDGYPHGESAAAGSSSELHGLCTGCHARSSESTPRTHCHHSILKDCVVQLCKQPPFSSQNPFRLLYGQQLSV